VSEPIERPCQFERLAHPFRRQRRRRDGKERRVRLRGNALAEQRLAGARRAKQEQALGRAEQAREDVPVHAQRAPAKWRPLASTPERNQLSCCAAYGRSMGQMTISRIDFLACSKPAMSSHSTLGDRSSICVGERDRTERCHQLLAGSPHVPDFGWHRWRTSLLINSTSLGSRFLSDSWTGASPLPRPAGAATREPWGARFM